MTDRVTRTWEATDAPIYSKDEFAAMASGVIPTEPQTLPTRDQIAEIIKDKVDYFLHDEQGPLDAADAILALLRPQSESGK